MHIKEIFINKYGKFEDFKLPMQRGFNLIYGENEAGKSTLHSFMRRMFYGMQQRDRGGVKTNDRARYMPFTGGNMSGLIKLDISGENIVISRMFGKTAAADKLSITDDFTGEEKSKLLGESSPGEILFGCSDKMFEKTLWLRQNGTYMGGSDDEITRRLINLAASGDEEISVNEAARKLVDMQKSLKAADNRGVPGKIDRLQRELNELSDEKLQFAKKQETLAELEVKHAALKKERAGVEKTIEEYQKMQNLVEMKHKFEIVQKIDKHSEEIAELESSDEFAPFANIDEARKLEISEKNREVEEISKVASLQCAEEDVTALRSARTKRKFCVAAIIIGGIMAIAGGVSYALIREAYSLITLVTAVLVVGLSLFELKKVSSQMAKLQAEIDEATQSELDKNAKIDILKQELDAIYTEFGVASYGELLERVAAAQENKTKIELLTENIQVLLGDKDLDELRREIEGFEPTSQVFETNKVSIDRTLSNGQVKLMQLNEQLQDTKREMNMLFAGVNSLSAITNNMAKCEEEIEDANLQLAAILIAREELASATNEMKNNFTPRLNSAANEVIEAVTGGKYRELRVSEGLEIKISQDGILIDGDYLSEGAFDQIYFALRMAIIKLVCNENVIIFLDDTFTQYDDTRLRAAFDYVVKLSQEHQIIMFTCQSRELELARQNENINIISI